MTKSNRRLKFEDAMTRLDAIVEAVEKGEIGIEESINKYEEAMRLVGLCRSILQEAEQRIQMIQLDAEGRATAVPFEPQADADQAEGPSGRTEKSPVGGASDDRQSEESEKE